jgi:hypothetical protein
VKADVPQQLCDRRDHLVIVKQDAARFTRAITDPSLT